MTTRIAMLSGPRNISTTMMRAFENRPDTVVFDEPFYACYLKASGAEHPMRDDILASQPTDWSAVTDQLRAPLPAGKTISFQKHITFHFAEHAPLDWLDDAKVFHLIREPRAMVASYKNKYGDVAPIIDSLKIQKAIYDKQSTPQPVIDSADIQRDPEGMLTSLCKALDIPFSDQMLSWPAGPRTSDGVWGAHWYDAVNASTGFRPYQEKEITLTPDLEEIAAACQPYYDFFYERRLITT